MPGQPQEARLALGSRLREIRLDAGLTARDLARLAGWHFTKISKLEHGTRPPSRSDIRAWCQHCQSEDQVADLIAVARSVDAMYTEWRRQMRSGMKHLQNRHLPLYEETTLFRAYETIFVPNLLATASYTAEVLKPWAKLMSLPADVDSAVAARMQRQNVLYTGNRHFDVLLEEQVLRTAVGDADVMAGQLDRLMATTSVPSVRLGIIPARAPRAAMIHSSYWIFDDTRVQVETPSALLIITQPAEISIYTQVFDTLQRSAVYGRNARELIGQALREFTSD
jgi:transcriptional regulator with XRE-family HTH domain